MQLSGIQQQQGSGEDSRNSEFRGGDWRARFRDPKYSEDIWTVLAKDRPVPEGASCGVGVPKDKSEGGRLDDNDLLEEGYRDWDTSTNTTHLLCLQGTAPSRKGRDRTTQYDLRYLVLTCLALALKMTDVGRIRITDLLKLSARNITLE